MKRVFLVRVSCIAQGCFGVLLDDLMIPFAVTVEKTVEGGRPVLLEGTYRCLKDFYHKGGYPTFEIQVSGHDRILFHKGNVEDELEGCVAVASRFGTLDSVPAVLDSAAGFNKFWDFYKDEAEIELEIVEAATAVGGA